MSFISTNDNILRIEGRETKFDTGIVSNSLVALLDSVLEARIVQQLHYWTVQEYGKVINGLRWIYKPIREWLTEALIGFTSWQLRKAIASLVEKGILFREHLFKEHHGNNFAPKNRTYYYSLNYKGLEEYAEKHKTAETIENVRFVSDTNQFCESLEKQFCEKTKNRAKNTSIKNNSKDQSHPTLPSGCNVSGQNNQNQKQFSTPKLTEVLRATQAPETSSGDAPLERPAKKKIDSVESSVIEQDKSFGQVEQNINQNINTSIQDEESVQEPVQVLVEKPKLKKTPKGTKPQRKGQAPWKDEGQFKRFYRALVQALPIVANSHSPAGLAQTIIRQLRSGIPHSYWDDFVAGLPIGWTDKPEWEVEPGVPYPAFFEYLTEKTKRGDNTQSNEQVRNEVFRILNQPRVAKGLWGEFKRSVVNAARQIERDRALGISSISTPTWSKDRIEPSIEEAKIAGKKIMAVNGTAQAVIASADNPQLESERQEQKSIPSPSIPDPWSDDDEPLPKNQPTLRELLTKRLGKRNLKGFMKQMPKVSSEEVKAEERAEKKPKTNIAVMSIAEINDYLTDPILRKQIMPQLWQSDYEFVTNEYGDIIGVRRPSSS